MEYVGIDLHKKDHPTLRARYKPIDIRVVELGFDLDYPRSSTEAAR